MQPEFWLDRWQNDQIGWHQPEHNSLLQTYWPELHLDKGTSAFVPLCGKSLDMRWLVEAGHEVIGVELSQLAVDAYFKEGREPVAVDTINEWFVRYRGDHTTIFLGDFFDLTAGYFPHSLGVFDRGSLVALPPLMRRHYVDHLLRVVPEGCLMLLLSLEYEQHRVSGPPHSVTREEIEMHYGDRCEVKQLDAIVTSVLPPHFLKEGVEQAVEGVYLIRKIR